MSPEPSESPQTFARRAGARIVAVITVAVLGLLLFISKGCSGNGSDTIEYPERKVKLPDLSKAGTVGGTITFQGNPPKRSKIPMGDAWCSASHHDADVLDDRLIVTEGRIKDVLVWVKSGLEAWTFDYVKSEATMDQRGCMFVPHVLAVRAFQPVVFKSSDGTSHNVNTSNSRQGQGFNRTLGNAGASFAQQFRKPELSLPATCNIHPWMSAAIHVIDHPYFVVTGEDGRFELRDLPEGDLVIEAVHPELGSQEKKVKIVHGTSETIDFTLRRR